MNISTWPRIGACVLAFCVSELTCIDVAKAQSVRIPSFQKIREYGAIYVGHRESSVPFSYYAGEEPVGYSKDICDKIVESIKLHLNNPALKVVLVPVSSSSRFLMLRTGMIDLECGSTTNTKIRQQSVAFSLTTFVSEVKAMVRKDSGIERISDLDKKNVVTTAGTTSERLVKNTMAARKLSAFSKYGRDHRDSFMQVLKKDADAFVIDEALLSGLIANSSEGDSLKLLEENLGYEPYAITMRRDDPEFKAVVDNSLREMMKSGELEMLYNKWFMSPIPPNNANLRTPMSEELKAAIRNPTDAGI
jgi:glutamate/aspartate transport system substrate-binding protein